MVVVCVLEIFVVVVYYTFTMANNIHADQSTVWSVLLACNKSDFLSSRPNTKGFLILFIIDDVTSPVP